MLAYLLDASQVLRKKKLAPIEDPAASGEFYCS